MIQRIHVKPFEADGDRVETHGVPPKPTERHDPQTFLKLTWYRSRISLALGIRSVSMVL
jgi:hypothetical protein